MPFIVPTGAPRYAIGDSLSNMAKVPLANSLAEIVSGMIGLIRKSPASTPISCKGPIAPWVSIRIISYSLFKPSNKRFSRNRPSGVWMIQLLNESSLSSLMMMSNPQDDLLIEVLVLFSSNSETNPFGARFSRRKKLDKLGCLSASTSKTFSPRSDINAPRLAARVVFPTPPFGEHTVAINFFFWTVSMTPS